VIKSVSGHWNDTSDTRSSYGCAAAGPELASLSRIRLAISAISTVDGSEHSRFYFSREKRRNLLGNAAAVFIPGRLVGGSSYQLRYLG